MKAKEGDTVRSTLNGTQYKIRKIQDHIAVLESQDGKSQILTELDTLLAFYQEKDDPERSNKT